MCGDHKVHIEKEIMSANDSVAMFNRGYLHGKDIYALNLISSPGAGKTSLLEATIHELSNHCTMAVIEGDQATTNDAKRIEATGVECRQINTANGCHLEAAMVRNAIEGMNLAKDSLLFIENVGNLVCPAMFDLGEDIKVVVISVTEGDDKPLKYPYIFAKSQVCVINKIDLLPYVNSDIEKIKEYALRINPSLIIFEVSATTGAGINNWCKFLLERLQKRIDG